MLVLDAAATRKAMPMAQAITAMETVMRSFGRGDTFQPLRSILDAPMFEGITAIKPAGLGGSDPAYGLKVASVAPGNPARGLATIQGFVALIDPQTGVPSAVLEGGVVTEIRTSAVSAVATDRLAGPDAGVLALIGAGVQARGHLTAISTVRTLRDIRVWNRTHERAEQFAKWAGTEGFEITVAETPEAAVTGADIVCTVTSSAEPIVKGDWLAPGAHVNAVGAFQPKARELHSDLVANATVIVDSRESALSEAGDLLIPISEGVIGEDHIAADLAEILEGRHPGRTNPEEITLFKSLGLAVQDVAAAAAAVSVARREGIGIEVSFP